ncbi:ATP synthase F1 subcomplex delta subunit [[Leptolyngbya] sp. PCC 7376]|uniref:ATP synthase F1 subunit delta n=1 Tax=[Leptolyngbya] sp. PCC 7376 TaxID=111781 RepID=UPI00029F19E6|nr:ATP synthase F1 subunit delta [[Leptolyngbya] sp. PCC 7376]AFY40492.1 ATP synthase F1 subcomplex delta subunit [[Leptolyngbya] sp. PCC 7376]
MKGSAMSAQLVEPYAEALMSLAKDTGKVDDFADYSRSFLTAFKESEEFRFFIANPLLDAEEQKGVLKSICGKDIDAYFLNFLFLLVDRRRIAFSEALFERFIALQRELKNIVLAQITCATALSREQEDAIAEQVKSITGSNNIELEITTDTSLIGGVIIKVGSQVFDASLRGQIRRISMGLLGTN